MSENLESPQSNTAWPFEGGHKQYQHQTWRFDNTTGLLLMSVLAFMLLVALLRQQARYHELAERWFKQE
jgi:succinate dehydrogenase hydrophobic anchor subunit